MTVGHVLLADPDRWGEEARDHIHKLLREVVVEDGVKYLYRCVTCNQRLRRKSGCVVVRSKK